MKSPILVGISINMEEFAANKHDFHTKTTISSEYPSRKKSKRVKEVRQSYIDGLTVHGMSKIFTGTPCQRVFWFVCLLAVISYSGYMTYTYISLYLAKDMRTEIRLEKPDEISMPALLVCSADRFNFGCHNNLGITNMESCKSGWDIKEVNYTSELVEVDEGCVLYNSNGTLKEKPYGNKIFRVGTPKGKKFQMMIAEPKILKRYPASLEFGSIFSNVGNFTIEMNRVEIERLPSPFPSDCSDGKGIEHLFSPIYHRADCVQSCYVRIMLKNCGTVIDRWKQTVLLANVTFDYSEQNLSDSDIRLCLRSYMKMFHTGITPKNCRCPLPCKKVEFNEAIVYKYFTFNRDIKCSVEILEDGGFRLYGCSYDSNFAFRYATDTVKFIKEVEAYPITSVLSNIGGIIGMFAGISLLSIVEVTIFLLVSCFLCYSK